MPPEGTLPTEVLRPITIVLGDANVLYPRVLRDYLVYASDQGAIALRWSREILDEVIEHLAENIASFTPEQGGLLIRLLNRAFPYAEVAPSPAARRRVNALDLPGGDDRHVLTAAVAGRADILCTDNIKDFPHEAMDAVGIELLPPTHCWPGSSQPTRPRCSPQTAQLSQPGRSHRRLDARRAERLERHQDR